jgi:hypothetical protein
MRRCDQLSKWLRHVPSSPSTPFASVSKQSAAGLNTCPGPRRPDPIALQERRGQVYGGAVDCVVGTIEEGSYNKVLLAETSSDLLTGAPYVPAFGENLEAMEQAAPPVRLKPPSSEPA